ncbi:hypothetical protein HMPREF0666_00022 [Prevotella sp. C561]|uniref:hypothetical protein n=1 Tax=Prevotella sp. C561 TaxID=563031 RepID=UPI00022373DF|nr:hypothetical protein [Prevotella sp. C561]EGW49538.1 hypothetical protein HMPREF0666_00022 [Prevotella sp. C561]
MIKLNELDLLYASSTARKDYVCPAAMLVHIEPEGCLAAGTTRMGGRHENAYDNDNEWEEEEDDN